MNHTAKNTLIAVVSLGMISLSLQHILEYIYWMIFDKFPVYFTIYPSFRFVNTDFNFFYLIEVPNMFISCAIVTYLFMRFLVDKPDKVWSAVNRR